jgi:hypothetical protein
MSGRLAEGAGLLERALDRAEQVPFRAGHSQWVAWLAHARLLAGRPEEARRLAEEAVAWSRKRGERGYEAWALGILGEVERQGGAASAAGDLHRQSLALALELGMQPLAARAHQALARLEDPDGAGFARP